MEHDAAPTDRRLEWFRPEWLHPIVIAAYLLLTTRAQTAGPHGPPFGLVLTVGTVAFLVLAAARGNTFEPLLVSVAIVSAASILTDINYVLLIPFPDLGIYLGAGRHLLDGQPVYQLVTTASMPLDRTTLPFLYPPPTIGLFALLAALPASLGGPLFVAGSVGLLIFGLRRLGLSWTWSLVVVAWPPVVNGIMSGNVSIALFGLFALAPWFGPGLVIAPLFKIYNAIAALWLLRERRFRSVAVGIAVILVAAILTLPFVGGVDAWRDWAGALLTFARTQQEVKSLYGLSLERYLPTILVLIAAAAVVVLALLVRGLGCLARLGVATIVAQPSLYIHGFIVALPALLELRSRWVWLAAAVLATAVPTDILPGRLPWPGPWLAVALVVASWAQPGLRRDSVQADEPYHPLGSAPRPWPTAAAAE